MSQGRALVSTTESCQMVNHRQYYYGRLAWGEAQLVFSDHFVGRGKLGLHIMALLLRQIWKR